MFAAGQKVHEQQQHQRVQPPGSACQACQHICGKPLQQSSYCGRNRSPWVRLPQSDPGAVQRKESGHQGGNHTQDQQCLAAGRPGVIVPQIFGRKDQAAGQCHQHTSQGNN